jgi:mannose-6-phosphate isomerase-like protein (cupin superfamily)
MTTDTTEIKNLKAFVRSLPADSIKYHEILSSNQSVSMKSGLVCLQPGENVGSHNTGNREELLIILNGMGEIETEGSGRRKINQGCVAYVPPNTQHNVFNSNSELLRYLYIVASVE